MVDDQFDPPAADTSSRRMVGIIAITISIVLSLLTAGFWPSTPQKVATPLAGFPIDYWDWGANRLLSTHELTQLERLGSQELFSLCGFIRDKDPEPLWEPEGRSSAPVPGKRQYLVVRIDAAIAKRIDTDVHPTLIPTILQGWERNRTPATIGLQIDCDVPTKKLAGYIVFLKDLRRVLPADIHLSITMLVDWINSDQLTELMHVVDVVAPQFYNTYVPFDPSGPTPLLGAQDLERAIEKLDAVGRPYRIGLPTYEQCSLYNADGSLLKPAIALSPEQALTAGGEAISVIHGAENIIQIRFPKAAKAGGQTFSAGQLVVFASATPQGLAIELATIRRLQPQHCAGVLLFRLPGRESTHSLSIDQVVAAAAQSVKPPRIVARIEPLGNQHYALIVSNQGDSDFIDFTSPVRVLVEAPQGIITPTLLPHYGFTVSNPISLTKPDHQKDGFELYLGLLRAGENITIEDMHIIKPDGTPAQVHGLLQRGDWSERF